MFVVCPFGQPHFLTGDLTLAELMAQPSPRLFTTHLRADLLPKQVKEGKGRIIYVLRNLNDVMVSLHYFRGEAKDGWEGNEHGPGSFCRFNSLDPVVECPNAYGCVYKHIKAMEELLEREAAGGEKRAASVVYYEALKLDTKGEIKRLAEFLKVPLTEKRLDLIVSMVTFNAMKANKGTKMLMRKGVIGDYKNHLTEKHWATMAKLFEERLSKSKLAAPLKKYI